MLEKDQLEKKALSFWTHTGRDVGARPYPIPPSDSSVQTNISIPVANGINLRGDLYIPTNKKGPFPAIFEVTPYGAQGLAKYGRIYASRGYLFLAVDCRGRYRSEGIWEPLTNDQEDGQSVIRWLSSLEICNSRLGSRGHSYSGYNQLLTAKKAPKELQAMVVGVAPGDPFENTPFQGGAYDLNDLFWLMDMNGRINSETDNDEPGKFDDPDLDRDEDDFYDDEDEEDSAEEKEQDYLINQALSARPFKEIDLRLGLYHETFREWISHWRFDDFWKKRSVGPHIDEINVPTLHISGWWDGNGRGATCFYEKLRKTFLDKNKINNGDQRLLMGPWNHDLEAPDCDDLPESEEKMIKRGAMRDSLNDEFSWFDHYLMDIPFGECQKNRVTLFLTGINRWFYLDDWPAPKGKEYKLYLTKQNKINELTEIANNISDESSYLFNPENPTPFGSEDADAERMPFDNSAIQKVRDDLLLYNSSVFKEDKIVVGPVSATLFASASTPDFDLCVSIYDIYPDGRSIFLTDGIIRARFREGYEHEKLVPLNEIHSYDIDLWHLGHVFRKGHQLRFQVSSASHLRFDINPCTGGPLSSETKFCESKISIKQGKETASFLRLETLEMADLEGKGEL